MRSQLQQSRSCGSSAYESIQEQLNFMTIPVVVVLHNKI